MGVEEWWWVKGGVSVNARGDIIVCLCHDLHVLRCAELSCVLVIGAAVATTCHDSL